MRGFLSELKRRNVIGIAGPALDSSNEEHL